MIKNKLTGERIGAGYFNPANGVVTVFKTFWKAFDVEIILKDKLTGEVKEHWINVDPPQQKGESL